MIIRCWPRRLLKWTLRLAAAAFVLGLAAVPVAYFGLPALARTPWARAKVERGLTRAVGAPVTVREVHFSWRTGLSIREVVLARGSWGDAEISARVPEIRVHRLRRRMTPVLESPEIRILDGTPEAPAVRNRACSLRLPRLDVRQGRLTYENPECAGGLVCEKIDARLSFSRRKGAVALSLSRVSAIVNGGRVSGSFSVARGSKSLSVRADLTGNDVAANDLLARLARPAAPVLDAPSAGSAFGTISFNVKGGGAGRDAAHLLSTAKADGAIALRDASIRGGRVAGSRVLRELEGRFSLHDGRLLNPSLEARFSDGETWRLMGWTEAGGRLDYAVRSSAGRAFSVTGSVAEPRVD